MLQEGHNLSVLDLGQGNLPRKDDERQDDDRKRSVESSRLEGLNVPGRQQGGVNIIGHGCRDGDEADDGVRQGAGDLVEHGTHREGDGLVTLASLPLPVI